MNSFYSILSIARYETKTLFRSWFFRIFTIISIVVLFFFNLEVLLEMNGGVGLWSVRALPSTVPYINLLFLNVVQAVIAVFLASDFLKRDKKLDTSEVIYVRPMSNSEYVLGKTLGNVVVFLMLNLIILVIALVFNGLSPEVEIPWMTYLYYFFLITIPTLVFILGLSFVVMSLVRNQAVTFVILLGYIAISLFYLKGKYYYLFDYMAFHIPMTYSDFIGFGNVKMILLQRGMYFLLGVGLIALTTFWLKRLSHDGLRKSISAIGGLICILAGIYLGYCHIRSFVYGEQLRANMQADNDRYTSVRPVQVEDYTIKLKHTGYKIQCKVTMNIENTDSLPDHQIVFSLNPGLHVSAVKANGKKIAFNQENGLVKLTSYQLAAGAKSSVTMDYSGVINEQACYLDIDEDTRAEEYSNFTYRIDKRYAFIRPDYVLLTREANWYPIAGASCGEKNKQWFHREFSNYKLTVKTNSDLAVLSQGKSEEHADGITFTSTHSQSRISLVIGNYQKLSTIVDGVKFQVFTLKGHDYFSKILSDIQDTIPGMIADELEDFERNIDLYYPFNHFSLIEVPVQFYSYDRTYTDIREQVQPGMVFFPEKGVLESRSDFDGNMRRKSNRFRFGRQTQNQTEAEKKIQLFRNFISMFTSESSNPSFNVSKGQVQVEEESNPYFTFPLFYSYAYYISSDRWPITDRIFASYKKSSLDDDDSPGWMRDVQGMSEDEEGNLALLSNSFESILNNPDYRQIADNVIQLKGETLFAIIKQKITENKFANFLYDFLMKNQFKSIPIKNFNTQLNQKFGVDLIPYMNDWFTSIKLPAFLIGKVDAYHVIADQQQKTMIQFKVTNASDQEGVLDATFRLGGGRGPRFGGMGGQSETIDKQIYMEGNQTKLISFVLNGTPRGMTINTMVSKNIPSEIRVSLGKVEENDQIPVFDGEKVVSTPVKIAEDNEIIEDNEDPGFRVDHAAEPSLLRRLLVPEEESTSKYSGFSGWRPPQNWTLTTNSSFYGAFIRSAYYIASGKGERKVSWNIPIKEPGYYEVYAYVYKEEHGPPGRRENGSYHYFVHTDGGEQEAEIDLKDASQGWNPIGSYYFANDTAVIVLTNQSKGRRVVADAIKLLKQ